MLKHQKQQPIVYNADGVAFTIYKTTKPTKSERKVYWLLEDYSTGKRRLLNNPSRKAAVHRPQGAQHGRVGCDEPFSAHFFSAGNIRARAGSRLARRSRIFGCLSRFCIASRFPRSGWDGKSRHCGSIINANG